MKKIFCFMLIVVVLIGCLTGCMIGTEATNVRVNLKQAADNFECLRKITVYNARTDLIILELEGFMSLSNNNSNELVVTCKVGENQYKTNYIFLNDYTLYVMEDITGTITDPYHYKIHFYTASLDVDINE